MAPGAGQAPVPRDNRRTQRPPRKPSGHKVGTSHVSKSTVRKTLFGVVFGHLEIAQQFALFMIDYPYKAHFTDCLLPCRQG